MLTDEAEGGEVVASYEDIVKVWGAANKWRAPIKHFGVLPGRSIEFLARNLLLRGGDKGELQFVDYAQIGSMLPPSIDQLHSNQILDMPLIAKNILLTASHDGYLKVIHPISSKCYLKFKENAGWRKAIAYFY